MTEEIVVNEMPPSFMQKHKFKLKVFCGFIVVFLCGWFLSSAFVVHGNDLPDNYWSSTSVLKDKLLDKAGFMSALTILTLITIALFVWGYWKIHSLPKQHSEHTGQPRLIFWLCMLGFIWGWLWIAAILIVVTDWDKISDVIASRKSSNTIEKDTSVAEIESHKETK
jgi:hypothetical protein